jgi:hypothetical protein
VTATNSLLNFQQSCTGALYKGNYKIPSGWFNIEELLLSLKMKKLVKTPANIAFYHALRK